MYKKRPNFFLRFMHKRKKRRQAADAAIGPHGLPRTADFNTKCDDILVPAMVKLFYWPSYSNPYQKLFYGAETARFDPQPAPIDEALNALAEGGGATVCFHIHWLNFLFKGLDEEGFAVSSDAFLKKCEAFCARGGLLIWTIHNLSEHDTVSVDVETRLRARLSDLATFVIVHGQSARDAIMTSDGIPAEKIVTINHGSYIGAYEDAVTRTTARATFGFDMDDTVFLNLGFLRAYKGIADLITNVAAMPIHDRQVKLLLAGKAKSDEASILGKMTSNSANILLYNALVEDDEIQRYMNASDFMVLPYKRTLTSGSALLALSFGVPVIGPALGALSDVIEDGHTGILYDPTDPDGLKNALSSAAQTTREQRATMRVAAFQKAAGLLWTPARIALFRAINEAVKRSNEPNP